MKRVVTLSLLMMVLALGARAQDYAPPPPLEDEHFEWLVGEWTGATESAMGKSKDWMKCEMGLGGQFLIMHFKMESEMGTFNGMGYLTLGPDGNLKGVWIDSWRNISTGTGTRDGTSSRMTWDGAMGKQVRVMKRVGDDKYVEEITMTGPGGMDMEARAEMTRAK